MSVSQRKDGRWLVKYKESGQWKQKSFRNETEARAFDAEIIRQTQDTDDRLTLGELAIRYFKARPDMNAKTKSRIARFLAEGPGAFLRNRYAESLNRQDLEAMRSAIRARKWQRGSGNNTVNKYQAYIRAILAWGVDNELIAFNPWRDFKRLKVVKPVIQPSIEDFELLYRELPPYLQWAVKTAFCLALRPGVVELLNLAWNAFNWRRGVVIIRQGKSGKLKTVVPPAYYLAEARQRFEADMAAGIPWVVHRGDGQKVLSFRTAWRNACKRAGVSMRPYDIRHIAATEMLARGADLAAVAAQLGHSSVAVTGASAVFRLATAANACNYRNKRLKFAQNFANPASGDGEWQAASPKVGAGPASLTARKRLRKRCGFSGKKATSQHPSPNSAP